MPPSCFNRCIDLFEFSQDLGSLCLIRLTKVLASLTLDLTELGSIIELTLTPSFSHNKNRKIKNAYFGFAELEGDLGLCGE